jgi:hypothetical protein
VTVSDTVCAPDVLVAVPGYGAFVIVGVVAVVVVVVFVVVVSVVVVVVVAGGFPASPRTALSGTMP